MKDEGFKSSLQPPSTCAAPLTFSNSFLTHIIKSHDLLTLSHCPLGGHDGTERWTGLASGSWLEVVKVVQLWSWAEGK